MSSRPLLNCLPQLRRATLIHDGGGLTDGQLLGEFIRSRDEAAFACLVKRHAPMVFGVCRRIVGDSHIAEDAFQAVFLVLARRATIVRPREQVGNWLFGVAYRTALKARTELARRRSKEKQVLAMPHTEVMPPEIWHDVQAVLDEELARLPDKLRLAVVLCDLEGRPQREVARQLRLPPTTLANRVMSGAKASGRTVGTARHRFVRRRAGDDHRRRRRAGQRAPAVDFQGRPHCPCAFERHGSECGRIDSSRSTIRRSDAYDVSQQIANGFVLFHGGALSGGRGVPPHRSLGGARAGEVCRYATGDAAKPETAEREARRSRVLEASMRRYSRRDSDHRRNELFRRGR